MQRPHARRARPPVDPPGGRVRRVLGGDGGTPRAAANAQRHTPHLRIGSAQTAVDEGSAYTLSLSATGAGASDVTAWTINWGDGPAQTFDDSPLPGSVTHVYADGDADHEITATATIGGESLPASVAGPGGTPIPNGTPDPTYGPAGGNGTVVTDLSPFDSVGGSTLQADGKLVVVGITTYSIPHEGGTRLASRFLVARYNTDGSLDPTFDNDGVADDVVAGHAIDVAVLPGGDILVAGVKDRVLVLARYFPNGQRNPILGVTTGYDGFCPNFFPTDAPDSAPADGDFTVARMVVQDDGGVLLAGTARPGDTAYIALGRLKPVIGPDGLPNGALTVDASFGGDRDSLGSRGLALARFEGAAAGAVGSEVVIDNDGVDLALDNDGDILVSGTISFEGVIETEFDGPVTTFRRTGDVVRFSPAGQLDTSFGAGGVAQISAAGGYATPRDMHVDAADRIVLAGYLDNGDGLPARLSLHRFLDDGTPDAGFGAGGLVLPDLGDVGAQGGTGESLLIQADGQLVVAGVSYLFDDAGFHPRLALSRHNGNDGSLDTGFADGGIYVGAVDTYAVSLNQQADGKLILASLRSPSPDTGDVIVTRFGVTGGGTLLPSLPVHVDNVAPTITGFTAPSLGGVRQETLNFAGAFADPGADDWTITIDFGDGAVQSFRGGRSFAASHVYGATGTFDATVTVDDGDGGTDTADVDVTIVESQLRPDPLDPSKTMLVFGAPDGANAIGVSQSNGQLTVTEGGQPVGTFGPTGRFRILAGAGNDVVVVSGGVTTPAEIYGGGGNDLINGGNGGNIIVGGDGADAITAGTGRDLLVGGRGADVLIGNPGDDLLIAGYTAYDADPAALAALHHQWARADQTYAQRVATLSGAATPLLPYRLHHNATAGAEATVFDDSDGDTFAADLLNGGSGNDWYFANVTAGSAAEGTVRDRIVGNTRGETSNDVDPAA